MDYKKYSSVPLKQKPNRVWRSYTGGALIDRWRGTPSPSDGDTPEEWVASTVCARGVGRPQDEGLSVMELPGGGTALLKDLIASDPEAFLGKKLAREYGDTALLVKMLDSKERLTIQVHPDKLYAQQHLGSRFGKTEGWYILGGRPVDGQESYVLMGFKEGVTRESWAELFYKQDIGGMINSLHKIYVRPGDVFIINGGVPHAIGSGCFLLEIQEPTDYTMRVEKTTPAGKELDGFLVHQGLGEEKMLDCFHYEPMAREEATGKWKIPPVTLENTPQASLKSLIGPAHTGCFSLRELTVRDKYVTCPAGSFLTAIVYQGEGVMSTTDCTMPVTAGDEIFIPASAPRVEWSAREEMKVLLCYPPE